MFVLAVKKYLDSHSMPALLVVAFVTALACVTRYAGVTVIGTGGMLLLFDSRLEVKKKIGHILLYGVVSCSLLAVNLFHNAAVTHTGTGPRYKSLTSLSENMHYFGTVMCDWFTLNPSAYTMAFTITALLVVGFFAGFLFYASGRRKNIRLTRILSLHSSSYMVYS